MKLIEHLSEINCSSRNPALIREVLISRGITPSIGQVRRALKTLVAAQTHSEDDFNCPICPDGQATAATHDQAYHEQLRQALVELKTTLSLPTADLTLLASLPAYITL